MTPITIIEFLFFQEWKTLTEATKNYNVLKAENTEELVNILCDQTSCLILVSIKTKNDLIQLTNLVKNSKASQADCITKIAVTNVSGNKLIDKTIAKLGILDVIDLSLNVRALKFKVDFWVKSLEVQVKKNQQERMGKGVKPKETSAKSNTSNGAAGSSISWSSPLECENDIWLIQDENSCKKIMSKWLVRVKGPGPYAGVWEEDNQRPDVWKFQMNKEYREILMPEDGDWFFSGQKPEFDWKENVWLMSGSHFELFHHLKDIKFIRISYESKALNLTKNSDYAKTKEEVIHASFDKEITFSKKAQTLGENDSVDSQTDKLKNLSGRGLTDHISSKNLAGNIYSHDTDTKPGISPKGNNVRKGNLLDMESSHQKQDKFLRGHNEATKYESSDDLGRGKHENKKPEKDYAGKSKTDIWSNFMGTPDPTPKLSDDLFDFPENVHQISNSKKQGPQKPILEFYDDEELVVITEEAKVVSYIEYGNLRYKCTLEDYFESEMVFILSDNGLQIGTSVDVHLSFDYRQKNIVVEFASPIIKKSSDDQGQLYVTVKMDQSSIDKTMTIMKLYQARQEGINTFLQRVKGI